MPVFSTTITTEIEIDAAPREVWDVLADRESSGDWNPVMRECSGRVEVGQRLTNRMYPSDGKPVTFRPVVTVADPGRELRWLGRFVLPKVFDGEHSFVLTELPGQRTRLTQAETFSGLLVPFVGGMIKKTAHDFDLQNRALKAHLEKQVSKP
ncbi:SRPBCC domain-containing protein [Catenulispora yoronensis]